MDPGNPASEVEFYVPALSAGKRLSILQAIASCTGAEAGSGLGFDTLGPVFHLRAEDPVPPGLLCALRVRHLSESAVEHLAHHCSDLTGKGGWLGLGLNTPGG